MDNMIGLSRLIIPDQLGNGTRIDLIPIVVNINIVFTLISMREYQLSAIPGKAVWQPNFGRVRLSPTSKRTLDELPSILVFIVHPKG